MDKPQTIYFTKEDSQTDDLSAWYCVKMTWHYLVLSVTKISRVVDSIVHEYAWLVLVMVMLVSFLVSGIYIHLARAERDQSCKRQYQLEQQVQSLQCQLEISKNG